MKQTIHNLLEELGEDEIVSALRAYYQDKYFETDITVKLRLGDHWVNIFVYEDRLETDEEYSERLQKEKEKEERGREAKIILAQTAAESFKRQYEQKMKELEELKKLENAE